MGLINGRTPEEIKRGIKCHVSWGDCSTECPYDDVRNKPAHECIQSMTKDALALIERLEAERDAALAKVPKWIGVEEKLPRKGQSVYILIRGRVSYPAKFYSEEEKLFAAFTGNGFFMVGCDRDGGVTHWAPLPEPTKE